MAPPIKKVGEETKLAMTLYGHPGVGKTTLLGTAGEKLLVVRPPTDHTTPIQSSGASEWVVQTWEEMREVDEYLRHTGADGFDYVAFDSISLFQDHGVRDIFADIVAEKPHRLRYGMDKGEYGTNMERLVSFLQTGVAAPGFHFIVTAHPAELPGPDGEELWLPYVQGKGMGVKLCGMMNVVARLTLGKNGKDRLLYTDIKDDYYAKDGFNKIGSMKNPTLPGIVRKAGLRSRPARSRTQRRSKSRRRT